MVADACILGCPETRFYLLDRCGKQTLFDLTDSVSFDNYGRVLDDTSELELSLHFRGDKTGRACCEMLENTRTWRHEILVVRGDEVAWGSGPIVTIHVQRDIAHVVARDISAWLGVRLVHTDYDFHGVDLSTIAETVIVDALTMGDAATMPSAERDVCILDYAHFSPAGIVSDLKVVANQQSAMEVLKSLTDKGLDFTVVQRSLIVGAGFAFGPAGPLRDEDFVEDLEVAEHGLAAATSWRVGGDGVTGKCGGVDPYYGLIERAVEGVSTSTVQADVDAEACARLTASNPPPVTVDVPGEGRLAATAPACLDSLVPGTLFDVAVTGLCRGFQNRRRLTAVSFRSDEKGEQVGVTLAPLGPLALAASVEEA